MHQTTTDRNVFLNQSEAIFEFACIGILVIDLEGKIKAINPFALNEFGYFKNELVGKEIEVLIPSSYSGNDAWYREIYNETSRPGAKGASRHLVGLRKDGGEFPADIRIGNFSEGGKEFLIVFIHNTLVRKNAEARIKKLRDELESKVNQRTRELTSTLHQFEESKEELSRSLKKEMELSELKSRFVTLASHEFRTPLSTVLSSAYLIGKYTTTDDQPKREKHLVRITSAVTMLTDTLNDFLNVGRIEEGKIPVRLIPLNIQELIISIAGEVKNTLKKNQKIYYHHEGDSSVMLDSSLLKHIILNLVSNASKFSSEGCPIGISTSCSEENIILSVKDQGIGISMEDQRHLLERFFRGANATNVQGTGLGLHIVSKYAELMNGTIECISELGKGSEFIITFITKPDYHEKDSTD